MSQKNLPWMKDRNGIITISFVRNASAYKPKIGKCSFPFLKFCNFLQDNSRVLDR